MIVLPNYEVIVPDGVYSKPITSYGDYMPCNPSVIKDTSEVVALARFRVPALDNLVERVTSLSLKLSSRKEFEVDRAEAIVAETLFKMDRRLINLLATEDGPTIAHLRTHYPSRGYRLETDYLNVYIGLMPNPMIAEIVEIGLQKGSEEKIKFFITNLKHMKAEWYIRLRLETNMELPEIESLLEMGVTESSVIDIGGGYGTFQNVASHTMLLYKALDKPEKIGFILDEQELMEYSLIAHMLRNLQRCSSMQSMQRHVENAIERAEGLNQQSVGGTQEKPTPVEMPAVEIKEPVWTKEELLRRRGRN